MSVCQSPVLLAAPPSSSFWTSTAAPTPFSSCLRHTLLFHDGSPSRSIGPPPPAYWHILGCWPCSPASQLGHPPRRLLQSSAARWTNPQGPLLRLPNLNGKLGFRLAHPSCRPTLAIGWRRPASSSSPHRHPLSSPTIVLPAKPQSERTSPARSQRTTKQKKKKKIRIPLAASF